MRALWTLVLVGASVGVTAAALYDIYTTISTRDQECKAMGGAYVRTDAGDRVCVPVLKEF